MNDELRDVEQVWREAVAAYARGLDELEAMRRRHAAWRRRERRQLLALAAVCFAGCVANVVLYALYTQWLSLVAVIASAAAGVWAANVALVVLRPRG